MLNELELTGRARTHVVQLSEPRFAAQPEAASAFMDMREAARRDGIDLLPVSSFRDFRTQLRIWNGKFSGSKPLYDMQGRPRDFSLLSATEIIHCILNWSALPGGSRHQWGTEIDVVDGAAMPPGYVPQLLPEEVAPGGLFRGLHQWLDANMAAYGFFRPYRYFKGGMYPEPWHLSYAPLSVPALSQVSVELLAEALSGADILGKDLVLEMLPDIYRDHILNIVAPDDQG
ncbi:M15 family metallopeptidase [Pseudomonas sp. ZM23]|uniref:M15 family metallopeptidase n=1 Tax=Pseudomonas triclosanedens TaxID=2961893 RepID=A0ABY6ZWU7_9PSED|nr:M15 family metallopeptidase [Pseudomonas triclosanedens]MCP8466906.1 M15 family metallopeptidase [Pseudomonas triclosanedens]MCP8470130.1 M15 family metallopeptidase [Pseudomonas triclosanedens]MCP8478040.1 M15 family metallopeptidase [Pseudomonas triclosanedens]WAI49452.1 M15 family metallopeptidase [Pseudomonas triclosanedens]